MPKHNKTFINLPLWKYSSLKHQCTHLKQKQKEWKYVFLKKTYFHPYPQQVPMKGITKPIGCNILLLVNISCIPWDLCSIYLFDVYLDIFCMMFCIFLRKQIISWEYKSSILSESKSRILSESKSRILSESKSRILSKSKSGKADFPEFKVRFVIFL